MKLLSWLVTLPIIAVIASFAFSNKADVTLGFWPFDYAFAMPLYAAVLSAFVFGLFIGTVTTWAISLKYRFESRKLRKEMSQRDQVKIDILPPEKAL